MVCQKVDRYGLCFRKAAKWTPCLCVHKVSLQIDFRIKLRDINWKVSTRRKGENLNYKFAKDVKCDWLHLTNE